MHPPNILITNFCNQNCPFCFASNEMRGKRAKREMSMPDFRKALRKMKKESVSTVKLLGGEPTLHSKFGEILALSCRDFSHVQVFTNGIFPNETARLFLDRAPRVALTINVMTPGFLFNPKTRSLVSERIAQLSPHMRITLSLTFDMHSDMDMVFEALGQSTLKHVHRFRLGFSNPVAGERNFYGFDEFPLMGKKLASVISRIRKNNSEAGIILNCGLTRCMFTDLQFRTVRKETEFAGFGCLGKRSFDLQTDLSAFGCFPLSHIEKSSTHRKSYASLQKSFLEKRFDAWTEIRMKRCRTCPFFGIGAGKCPGPCIAFVLNAGKAGTMNRL
jgi:MoaA/NifB/PqqE/SkfB family radical SAM enzyme